MRVASPSGPALRLKRPSWRDPRLAIGVVLVLASVVLGALVVSNADDTVGVYAARDTIMAGDTLDDDAVTVVQVRIDDVDRRYVPAERGLDDQVAIRMVPAGELLPLSAVGDAATVDRRPVAIPLGGGAPEGLGRGSLVDVWIAAETEQGDFEPPVKALVSAEVSAVSEAGGGLAALETTTVSVLLDDGGTAQVLTALANGDRVDVVVVPGSALRR